MITEHFKDRISRMIEIGLNKDEIKEILNKARKFLFNNPTKGNSAILVKEFDDRQYCMDGSSGDEAWVITQQGNLATIMLRPRNRPKTPDYFRNVDYVFTDV
jgi:hypothetical protein